jgi:MFS family permease
VFGEARLALAGLATMAVGLAAVAGAAQSWMLYPLVGCMALGSGLAIPSLGSLVSRGAGAARQGATMGGMQALLSLTLILGPAIAGLLYDWVAPGGPYLCGGLLSAAALLAAWRGLGGGGEAGRGRALPEALAQTREETREP